MYVSIRVIFKIPREPHVVCAIGTVVLSSTFAICWSSRSAPCLVALFSPSRTHIVRGGCCGLCGLHTSIERCMHSELFSRWHLVSDVYSMPRVCVWERERAAIHNTEWRRRRRYVRYIGDPLTLIARRRVPAFFSSLTL